MSLQQQLNLKSKKQDKSEQAKVQSCWTPIFTGLVESVLFFL